MARSLHRPARKLKMLGHVAAVVITVLAMPAHASSVIAAEELAPPSVSVNTGDTSFDGFLDVREAPRAPRSAATPRGPSRPDPNKYLLLPECTAARMLDGMLSAAEAEVGDPCRQSSACVFHGGGEAAEIFRLRPGDDGYQSVGVRCPNGQTADPGELGRSLRAPFTALVPPQRPGVQPKGRALINAATIFYAGQPATMDRVTRVQGLDVRIVAAATFTWQFDKGVRETFSEPGAPYPNKDVTHTYRLPGQRRITLTTTWRGRYQVGDGPLHPIPGTVEQVSEPLPLTLVESRPQLVAPER